MIEPSETAASIDAGRPLQIYQQALAYLYSYANYEQKPLTSQTLQDFDLDRVRALVERALGPSLPYPSVHVAGTKGKGSTCAMAESILRAAGHRTGLFTSPHLHSFRERIRVDGRSISAGDVVEGVNRLAPAVARIPGLTTFEIATALALAHFARQGVEIAVVEVGLGGRLDATNIIEPLVTVITSISFDHTQVLGDSLAEIAREKGGIIKLGAQVVSAPQRPEAMGEIREICEARGAMLRVVGEDWVWEEREFDLDGQSLTVTSRLDPGQTYPNLQIPLLGEHQMVNAATAVAISELLRAQGLPVSDEAIRAGLRSVEWPGRMELLARAPAVLVDGAHNGDSAGQLARSIRRHFGARPLTAVFGASAGKDVPGMLDALLPEARRLILTRSRNERALDPRELREAAAGWSGPTEAAGSVEEALRSALEESAPDEIICVTGSLFLVTEAREAWLRMAGQPLPELDPQIEAG